MDYSICSIYGLLQHYLSAYDRAREQQYDMQEALKIMNEIQKEFERRCEK